MLVMPYGEESGYCQKEQEPKWMRSNPMNSQEQQFNMDYNMLIFIARHGRMSMAPKRAPNLPFGPCYNCLDNHFIKDFPHPRQPRQVPMANPIQNLARYCLECGIKHLVQYFTLSPKKNVKATLNLLDTIPSNGNQCEEVILVMAMTRAQDQKKVAQPSFDEEGFVVLSTHGRIEDRGDWLQRKEERRRL